MGHYRLAACSLLACSLLVSPLSSAINPDWFPKKDLLTIGVYYYPEAWPSSQWARDMSNIRKLGMEYVHMGEFAWYFMEPTEGHYDFAWLDKNVELAHQNGLKVVLCTPSATPPIWLEQEHPEILMVDAQGRTMQHGSREQADWSSPVYREYVRKIDTELAKHYGNDPRVWGWQIDNELSHYGKRFSYSKASTQKFRAWLQERYGTIDRLNEAWGGAFWSTDYQNFNQIQIPNREVLVADPSPHAELDFERWFAHEAADYIKMQAGVIRQFSKDQWITTNFMQLHEDVGSGALARYARRLHLDHVPGARRLISRRRPARLPLGRLRADVVHVRLHASVHGHFRSHGIAAGPGELGRN